MFTYQSELRRYRSWRDEQLLKQGEITFQTVLEFPDYVDGEFRILFNVGIACKLGLFAYFPIN